MKVGYAKYFSLSLLVVAVDQIVKISVHYYMSPGISGQIPIIADFFKLHYLTNPGMAFGLTFGSDYGKFFLTFFRIVAMFVIGIYMINLIRKRSPEGYLICMSLILGGAVGNLIDSVFYGVWFDNAEYGTPMPWFYGQVIDMFYIDIWEGYVPQWIPLFGGSHVALWPVFNVADACIFVSVCWLLIFQKKYFPSKKEKKNKEHDFNEKNHQSTE